MITKEEQSWLAEVEERAGKATEGPWKVAHNQNHSSCLCNLRGTIAGFICPDTCADETFKANSRTDIPRLLALVKRLVEENLVEKDNREYSEALLNSVMDDRDATRSKLEVIKNLLKEVNEVSSNSACIGNKMGTNWCVSQFEYLTRTTDHVAVAEKK